MGTMNLSEIFLKNYPNKNVDFCENSVFHCSLNEFFYSTEFHCNDGSIYRIIVKGPIDKSICDWDKSEMTWNEWHTCGHDFKMTGAFQMLLDLRSKDCTISILELQEPAVLELTIEEIEKKYGRPVKIVKKK